MSVPSVRDAGLRLACGSEVMGDDKGRQTTAEFTENVN